MIATLALLFVVLLTGLVFVWLGRFQRRPDLGVGVGFLVGCCLITVAMLLFSGAGVAWSPLPVAGAAALLALAGIVVRKVGSVAEQSEEPRGLDPADVLIGLFLLLHALYVTESSPRTWDYWAIWGLKAKVFFVGGGTIDWSFLADPANGFAHPDYPPLLTLLYAFLASVGEGWNDRWFGLLETAFVAALLLVIRGSTAKLTSSVRVGAWTAAVMAVPVMQFRIGIADAPLIAFVTAGLIILQAHLERMSSREMLIGFVLLGGGALTKNEGWTFLLIALGVTTLLTRRPGRVIVLAIPGMLLAATWQIARLALRIPTDLASGDLLESARRHLMEPAWIGVLLGTTPSRVTAALIALVVATFVARDRLRTLPLLLIVPAAQLVVYLLVYLGSPYDLIWHVTTSWDRISLHVAIPVLLAGTLALTERTAT